MRLHSSWFAARSADVSSARSADVSDPGTARVCGSGLLAPWHRMATVGWSMPASVYSRVARKISTLSLRSAVENGSFSCLVASSGRLKIKDKMFQDSES